MRVVVLLFELVAVVLFALEAFYYALRWYEIGGSAVGRRRGLLNVAGSFLLQYAIDVLLLLVRPLAIVWRFRARRDGHRPPVVCLHGYGGSRLNLFVIAWRLRRDGFENVAGVSYPSLGGDVHEKARRVAAEIDRIAEATGSEKVDIVAHSMGGLVARAYIRDHGGARRVRRLVTLGTPHNGTKVAVLAPDPLARSMAPDSRMLADLARDDPVPALVAVTSIFSTFDAKILPHRSASYRGAMNVEVEGIGHDAMLFSPKVYVLIREALASNP